MNPTDEDSGSDRIEAVPKPKGIAQREVEVIVIFSESEPGTSQRRTASPSKNRGRKKTLGPPEHLQVFQLLFRLRAGTGVLAQGCERSAPNPKRRPPPVSSSECSKESENSKEESERSNSPQENVSSAVAHPIEMPRTPSP